jgi:hypothetical protein
MLIDYMSDSKLDYRPSHARGYDETSDVDRDGFFASKINKCNSSAPVPDCSRSIPENIWPRN